MRELICIVCPRGCHLQVDDNNNVTGNFCIRGKNYALNELTDPKRMVTSTVEITGGVIKRLSVITSAPISKTRIFDVMEIIKKQKVNAPVMIGEVIIPHVLNLGVDIIATKTVLKEQKSDLK